MAYQEITIKKRTRKSNSTKKQETKSTAPKKRQNITRNNSTASKVCPRCGGTGRVR